MCTSKPSLPVLPVEDDICAHPSASPAGAFLSKPTAAQPHRLLFQPGGERSCRYEQYSRAEVLAALQGGSAEGEHPGMDIVVSGCSQRQCVTSPGHVFRCLHDVIVNRCPQACR
jgi:hypothetical protein